MKTLKIILLSMICFSTFAQVQIDKSLQLTGTGNDARIEGIDSVGSAKDAINVKTLQRGILLYSIANSIDSLHYIDLPYYSGAPVEGMVIYVKPTNNGGNSNQYLVLNGFQNKIEEFGLSPDPNVHAAIPRIYANYVYTFIFDGNIWRFNY